MIGMVLDSVHTAQTNLIETADDKALLDAAAPPVVVLTDTDAPDAPDTLAHLIGENNRPDPQWVRGRCPECGDDLISNMYFSPGHGYIIRWECWSSKGESPQCSYQRVL